MVFRNVIVDITIASPLFVFGQSCVEVFTSLSNVEGLAVRACDLINHSLSCLLLGSSLSLTLVSKSRNVVVGL